MIEEVPVGGDPMFGKSLMYSSRRGEETRPKAGETAKRRNDETTKRRNDETSFGDSTQSKTKTSLAVPFSMRYGPPNIVSRRSSPIRRFAVSPFRRPSADGRSPDQALHAACALARKATLNERER